MRPRRFLSLLAAATVSCTTLLTAGSPSPARAEYVPSCLSGVRMPQLCTLAVAIAGAGVTPDTASQLSAVTASLVRSERDDHCTAGVAGYVERYRGTTSGNLKGLPGRGTLSVEMHGCADGQVQARATSDTQSVQRTDSGTRRVRHRVTAVLSQSPGESQAFMSYDWLTEEFACRADGSCRPAMTAGSSPRPGGRAFGVPVAIRNTGMAARAEHMMETITYNTAGSYQSDATTPVTFEIGASVSGRWARTVHTVTTEGQPSQTFRATVKPDPGLWRVAPAS